MSRKQETEEATGWIQADTSLKDQERRDCEESQRMAREWWSIETMTSTDWSF
jgi:hypothetical protein